jgi:hypothetical protein
MKMREKPFGLQLVSLVLLFNIAYLASIWFSSNTLVLLEHSNIPYPAKIWLIYFIQLCSSGISSKIMLSIFLAWHIFTLFGVWKLRAWAHRSFIYLLVTMMVWGSIFPRLARNVFDALHPYSGGVVGVPAAMQIGLEAVAWLGEIIFLLWGLMFTVWFVIVPACALYYLTEPRIRVYFGIPIFQDREKYKRVSIVLYLALIILSTLVVLPFVYGLLSNTHLWK